MTLPKGAFYKKVIAKKNIKSAIKKVSYHQTFKIEDLSETDPSDEEGTRSANQ